MPRLVNVKIFPFFNSLRLNLTGSLIFAVVMGNEFTAKIVII